MTDKQAWALEQHEHDTRLTALQTSLEQKYKTLEHKEHEFRQTMMQEQQALRGEFDDDWWLVIGDHSIHRPLLLF